MMQIKTVLSLTQLVKRYPNHLIYKDFVWVHDEDRIRWVFSTTGEVKPEVDFILDTRILKAAKNKGYLVSLGGGKFRVEFPDPKDLPVLGGAWGRGKRVVGQPIA